MMAVVARDAGADIDHRAPFGELRAELAIFDEPLAQAVEAFGDDFAGTERQRLGALVDLDAGNRAGLLDELDQRRAVLGVLPDGLVVENDAGDVLRHRLGGAEQHFAVVAPVVGVDSTPMASKRFLIVPVDSSAARMPRPGATIASATLFNSARFIACSSMFGVGAGWPIMPQTRGRGGSRGYSKDLDARQRLAFEPFQESAARGRHVGEAAGDAGDVERRHRVAAAGNADKLAGRREFRGRFGHFDRAVVERLDLEGAERAVPDQRLGAGQHRDDLLDAARPDVEDHVVCADVVHRDDARRRVGRELLRHDHVDRQHDFAIERLCLGEDVARGRDEIVLAQRFADRLALRGEERVGHAAADDQRLDLRDQIAEQVELGRNLGAADDRRHRPLRCVQRLLQRFELLLHGAPGVGGEQMGDRLDRGVRAVRDREGVVDIDVAQRGELGGESGIVFFFALMEAGILQAQNIARL